MMNRVLTALLLVMAMAVAQAQDANTVLKQATAKMGADKVTSIHYTGSGYDFALGQNANPYIPYPRFTVSSYDMRIDYAAGTLREERTRSQYEDPIKGGSQQPLPERRETLLVQGNGAAALREGNPGPVPSPADASAQLPIWMTPHGFIKKATESAATVSKEDYKGKSYQKISFMLDKFTVTGYVDDRGLVTNVKTSVPNPLYGDMPVKISYLDYRDFGGIQFPGKIVETQMGFPTLELTINSVKTGVKVAVELPPRGRPPFPMGPEVPSEKVAEGVWLLKGGPHNSVAVEFADFVTVVEAPLGEFISMPVIATVKKLVPGKPIKYLVNTHHHFDHVAGFRSYAAEGATIVTHKQNLAFYRELLDAPRELAPDRLSKSGMEVKFETLTYKHVITDGKRTMEIHLIQGDQHSDGMLMTYLPKEKVLVEADVYNPGIPMMTAEAPPHPFSVNLYRNIQRLGLDVDKIVPIHGPVATFADLKAHVKVK